MDIRSALFPTLARITAEPFRLMHLAAGLGAFLAMLIWAVHLGGLGMPLALRMPAAQWHAHELVFGYGGAVLAGIFMGAPPRGLSRRAFVLMAAGLWLAGRAAIAGSAGLPPALVALLDLGFAPLVGAPMIAQMLRRPRLQTGVFVIILGVHWAANLAVHLDWTGFAPGLARAGFLAGILACGMMNAWFGGRLTQGMVRNRVMQARARGVQARGGGRDPLWAEAGAVAGLGLAAAAVLGLPWAVAPLLTLAGVAVLARVIAWRVRGGADAMLAAFLAAHLGLGAGALLWAAALWGAQDLVTAVHLMAIAALSGMSMAVMARGALGQTGRALAAPPLLAAGFAALFAAAVLRAGGAIGAPLALWLLAWALWLGAMGPVLCGPRLRPGTPGARPVPERR
ncbi:NnrS family protein [Phaeovulum vinaykumarii]|uniref:Uncharacterized protein involved in response to NO n=1 Tax=Phaeovulum vinaykumarii TaxID=407234 RepID=A0A1N7MLM0_9RHOB|nr:NnrS family protein [Phaeovulum vinaykumarii]SIS86920.1 uncharacterized protein involved in response to NO [Phaeovulum vinaykumarii]SOC13371.1 uncharacterized protein involved in response to NO [Phaeovulum vinaykumarii]